MESFGADRQLSGDDPAGPAVMPLFDGWQDESRILTAPIRSELTFIAEPDSDLSVAQAIDDQMVATLSQRQSGRANSDALMTPEERQVTAITADADIPADDRRRALEAKMAVAASAGNDELVRLILADRDNTGVDVNRPDADGSPPLIYAACFGHVRVVETLLAASANVNATDRNGWTGLMWAMVGAGPSHRTVAQLLLDYGADAAATSSSGRKAADFVGPNADIGGVLSPNDLAGDLIDPDAAEKEAVRKMMIDTAVQLDVDLDRLSSDDGDGVDALGPDGSDDESGDGNRGFVWDRCLNDQMFVFQESDLGRILDTIITTMRPKRSPTQKPVPANLLFLAARYAHYHVGPDLLDLLLSAATDKIGQTVVAHEADMTVLAFWMANTTLLVHYVRKDENLAAATADFQADVSDLANEIFLLIVRDAERRIDRVLDAALLQHEMVPGLGDVPFQGEWNLFRRRTRPEEPAEKRVRPPSPRQRAKTSPQTVISLLASTVFVLDLYDIHPVVTTQLLSQLLYWIGAELFNRIMSNRRYLARTKAMQIRMNIASLEAWVQANNRSAADHVASTPATAAPGSYDPDQQAVRSESTAEAAQRHFGPVVELLQWLQCFSTLGDDLDGLAATVSQLPALNPAQMLHAASRYRPEVGEPDLTGPVREFLVRARAKLVDQHARMNRAGGEATSAQNPSPVRPSSAMSARSMMSVRSARSTRSVRSVRSVGIRPPSSPPPPDRLLLDPSVMLPFVLPTVTDMIIRFGSGTGFGTASGADGEKARKYIPTVPAEFLARLDEAAGRQGRAGKTEGGDVVSDDVGVGSVGVVNGVSCGGSGSGSGGDSGVGVSVVGVVGEGGDVSVSTVTFADDDTGMNVWMPTQTGPEVEVDDAEIAERDRQEEEEEQARKRAQEGKRRWRFSLTS